MIIRDSTRDRGPAEATKFICQTNTMKPNAPSSPTRTLCSIVASIILAGTIQEAGAASLVWNGGGTDDNWSNRLPPMTCSSSAAAFA
jgi:hypothetical protein